MLAYVIFDVQYDIYLVVLDEVHEQSSIFFRESEASILEKKGLAYVIASSCFSLWMRTPSHKEISVMYIFGIPEPHPSVKG